MVEQPAVVGGNGRNPLRILIFTNCFYPSLGGVETYISLFAKGMFEAGCQPTVVTETAAAGFDDRQLPYPVIRKPGLIQFWKLLGDTDLVQMAGPSFLPLLLALLRGKLIVVEHHNYQAICPNGLLLYEPNQTACPGHFMAGRRQKCWRCVATSRGWAKSLWHWVLTFPRRLMCKLVMVNAPITQHVLNRLRLPRSRVIYYGIPDASIQTEPLVSISNAAPCFAYVGRLVAEKGLPLLVQAAHQLRERHYNFRLKFIGDGPERIRLEKLVAESGLTGNVEFTGFLSGDAFRRETQDVAAVVMPSIWEETAGLAAMEQMMRGRVVIASDIGGLGEVVGGAGLKFAPGDVEQLAGCMQRVLDQPGLITEIGQQARLRCLQLFRQENMIHAHLELYREVLQ